MFGIYNNYLAQEMYNYKVFFFSKFRRISLCRKPVALNISFSNFHSVGVSTNRGKVPSSSFIFINRIPTGAVARIASARSNFFRPPTLSKMKMQCFDVIRMFYMFLLITVIITMTWV